MNRFSAVLWMLVIVVATFMLYKVKYEVQSLKAQVADTSRELEQQRHALHVVAAEWAYLNRPERLKMLATKYLASSDLTVDQIAEIEALPFPGQNVASLAGEEGMKPASMRVGREGGGMR